MSRDWKAEIAHRLKDCPKGKLSLHLLGQHSTTSVMLEQHLAARMGPDDQAHLDILEVYPGVELIFQTYSARKITFQHDNPHRQVLEINHCRTGRIGWTMQEGAALYLGEGDVSLHGMAHCAQSEMEFPLEAYDGLCFSIDAEKLESHLPEELQQAKVSPMRIYKTFCETGKLVTLSANAQLSTVFDGLYTMPLHMLLPYARLKAQELLMLLTLTPIPEMPQTKYKAEQIETIRRIHEQLMADLSRRYTIEELSRQYLMNTATLKELFKTVYGQSLAAHMKEHRMERGAELLRTTELTLAEIASQVGYESQSKFSTTFKSLYGVLPKDYRKQNQ